MLSAVVSIGEFAHSTLTLFLDTVSFVWVGAYALVQGGLSLVVVTLTRSIETPVLSI